MKKGAIGLLSLTFGGIVGTVLTGRVLLKKNKSISEFSDKHLAILKLYSQWMERKQEGKSVAEYLVNNGYFRIAIYGMSFVGETLYNELKDSKIHVSYAIDRNADTIYSDLEMKTPDSKIDNIDAIIITSNYYYDEIKEMLEQKVDVPILNIEDIIWEM